MSEHIAYCVKCRQKKSITEVEHVKMKNGRPAIKGKCSACGTGVYKILAAEKGVADAQPSGKRR